MPTIDMIAIAILCLAEGLAGLCKRAVLICARKDEAE